MFGISPVNDRVQLDSVVSLGTLSRLQIPPHSSIACCTAYDIVEANVPGVSTVVVGVVAPETVVVCGQPLLLLQYELVQVVPEQMGQVQGHLCEHIDCEHDAHGSAVVPEV